VFLACLLISYFKFWNGSRSHIGGKDEKDLDSIGILETMGAAKEILSANLAGTNVEYHKMGDNHEVTGMYQRLWITIEFSFKYTSAYVSTMINFYIFTAFWQSPWPQVPVDFFILRDSTSMFAPWPMVLLHFLIWQIISIVCNLLCIAADVERIPTKLYMLSRIMLLMSTAMTFALNANTMAQYISSLSSTWSFDMTYMCYLVSFNYFVVAITLLLGYRWAKMIGRVAKGRSCAVMLYEYRHGMLIAFFILFPLVQCMLHFAPSSNMSGFGLFVFIFMSPWMEALMASFLLFIVNLWFACYARIAVYAAYCACRIDIGALNSNS
jgi:hypothetical protein